jgi:hypothetical protein
MSGDITHLKNVLDSSSQLAQWASAIGAGSVVIIIRNRRSDYTLQYYHSEIHIKDIPGRL